jgi:hypothetical protein
VLATSIRINRRTHAPATRIQPVPAQIDSLIDLKMRRARNFGTADQDKSMPVRLRDAAARLLLRYL